MRSSVRTTHKPSHVGTTRPIMTLPLVSWLHVWILRREHHRRALNRTCIGISIHHGCMESSLIRLNTETPHKPQRGQTISCWSVDKTRSHEYEFADAQKKRHAHQDMTWEKENRHTATLLKHHGLQRRNALWPERNITKSPDVRDRRFWPSYPDHPTSNRQKLGEAIRTTNKSIHTEAITMGNWRRNRQAFERETQTTPLGGTQTHEPINDAHTKFEVHLLPPICPVFNGVESIIWTRRGNSIV